MEKATRPSLTKLLEPVHAATARASVTIEEIDSLADRALEEARREREANRAAKAP